MLKNIEVFLFIGFIVASLFIDTYKMYLLLVAVYFGISLLLIEDVATATWTTFVSLLLFFKTKNFTFFFGNPEYYQSLIGEMPNITYFVSFADAFLFLLLYIVFIRDRSTYSFPFKVAKEDLLVIGLILVGMIASMNSFFPAVSWFWLFQFVKYILVFYLAKILSKVDPSIVGKTVRIFLIFCLFNAALVIFQKMHGGPLGLVVENMFSLYGKYADESAGLYRPGGMYWDTNLTATFFTVSLPFFLTFSFTKNTQFIRILSLLSLFAVVLALFFTASRAAWIVSFVLTVIMLYFLKQRKLLHIPQLIKKYVLVLGSITLLIAAPLLLNRVASIGQTLSERGGLFYRVNHIVLATDLMVTSVTGVGMNMFQYEILRRYDPDTYFHDSTPAHNILAEVGSSMGVVGLILFILLVILTWKHYKSLFKVFKKNKSRFDGYTFSIGFSILAYFLCSQFYPWLFSSAITSVIWIFLGFSYAFTSQTPKKTA